MASGDARGKRRVRSRLCPWLAGPVPVSYLSVDEITYSPAAAGPAFFGAFSAASNNSPTYQHWGSGERSVDRVGPGWNGARQRITRNEMQIQGKISHYVTGKIENLRLFFDVPPMKSLYYITVYSSCICFCPRARVSEQSVEVIHHR